MINFRSIRISMLPYKYRLQKSYHVATMLIKQFGSVLVNDVENIKTDNDKKTVLKKYNIKDDILDSIMTILQMSFP